MTVKKVKSDAELKRDKTARIMEGVGIWASYWRANLDRFCAEYLGIKLKTFQKIILWMMNYNTNFYYIASRGQGKTFLTALFAVCRCILWPGQKIIVVSYTFKQSRELISKITEDFMHRSQMLNYEIQYVKTGQNDCAIYFKNGSFIQAVTATDSSRGRRSHILLCDESRLLPQKVVDTVLRPMNSTPRHPAYLDKPEYANYPQEMNKEIYMSSAWFANSEMMDKVKAYAANMFNERLKYMVIDLPYMLSIAEGLLMREQIEQEMSEATFSDVTFSMERLGLFYGSAEDALFDFNVISKQRVLQEAFRPLDYYQQTNHRVPDKQKGEIRVLSVDIALMATRKHANDASALMIHSAAPAAGNAYFDNIVYIETAEGLRTEELGLLVMRFYYQYKCDYIVIDKNGVGLSVLDYIMADRYDPLYGQIYPALNVIDNPDLQERCKVRTAPKVIYAIQANSKSNNDMALALRAGFQNGYINLLMSDTNIDEQLSKIRGWSGLTDTMQAKIKLPYIQTTFLVDELINLQHEVSNGLIKVKERTGMRKDRYSSLEYGYAIVQELGRKKRPATTESSILDKIMIRPAKKVGSF